MAQSVLATLGQRTNTEAATAGNNPSLKTGITLNGEWLYDRFIENDEAEATKMGIARHLASNHGITEIKDALKQMVAIAKERGGPARYKTAQNHQSVMRAVIGALKFCGNELNRVEGYSDRLGYQAMRVVAVQALKAKGIKWDGTKVKSDEQREQERYSKEAKQALEEVQMENPQKIGESIGDWLDRIKEAVDVRTQELRQDAYTKKVDKMADRILGMFDDEEQQFFWDVLASLDAKVKERDEKQGGGENQSSGEDVQSEEQEPAHA